MSPTSQSFASVRRTALVTGASSGLGKAIADRLLEDGLHVCGTTRDPHRQNLDQRVDWITFEGSNKTAVAHWIKDNGELLKSIDILINNCGAGLFGDLAALSPDRIDANLQLLLGTPIALTQTVLETMRERGGAIVNVSSLASQFPLPWMSVYTAAKAGLSAFTQSLMLTESTGRVVLIDFQPGDFRTAFNRNMQLASRPTDAVSHAWQQMESLLESAPHPELGARDLVRAMKRGKSGIVRSGGFFQARIAPLGIRLLPRKWLLAAIRRYYQLDSR